MFNRIGILFILGLISFGFTGCSYRAWHEGFRVSQRQECYKLTSHDAMQKCLDKVDNMSYDEYEKARKDAIKHDE